MSATIELRFKALLDEFTFYRSQLQQTYLLAFEGSMLAFMSPPLMADVLSHFPNHALPPNAPSTVGLFLLLMASAWGLLIVQAAILLWPGRQPIDVPFRLEAIFAEKMRPYRDCALSKEAEDKIADIARLRIITEVDPEIGRLQKRRDVRLAYSVVTLAIIIATFIAAVAADIVLVRSGFHSVQ